MAAAQALQGQFQETELKESNTFLNKLLRRTPNSQMA
jgi:hypothetical protein